MSQELTGSLWQFNETFFSAPFTAKWPRSAQWTYGHHHNHCQAWSVAISGNFSGNFLFSHNTTLLKGQEFMDLEEDEPVRVYSTPPRNVRQSGTRKRKVDYPRWASHVFNTSTKHCPYTYMVWKWETVKEKVIYLMEADLWGHLIERYLGRNKYRQQGKGWLRGEININCEKSTVDY